MAVYFIQTENSANVKIGVAKSPEARLKGLQDANHEMLFIIRVIDGARIEERWLHNYFSKSHIRGEWFTYDPEMLTILFPQGLDNKEVIPPMTDQEFKQIRKTVGISQERLGKDMGRTSKQIRRYEHGKAEIPFLVAHYMSSLQMEEAG